MYEVYGVCLSNAGPQCCGGGVRQAPHERHCAEPADLGRANDSLPQPHCVQRRVQQLHTPGTFYVYNTKQEHASALQMRLYGGSCLIPFAHSFVAQG